MVNYWLWFVQIELEITLNKIYGFSQRIAKKIILKQFVKKNSQTLCKLKPLPLL